MHSWQLFCVYHHLLGLFALCSKLELLNRVFKGLYGAIQFSNVSVQIWRGTVLDEGRFVCISKCCPVMVIVKIICIWVKYDWPQYQTLWYPELHVSQFRCSIIRELKQQRFWATHVNRKWPFFIFWRWFHTNFQSNRLYNSKEAKEYKFSIIKAC